MKIVLSTVAHRGGNDLFDPAANEYFTRLGAFASVESMAFRNEEALFEFARRKSGRTSAHLALLEGRGKPFSSEEFARWLATRRDSGQQALIFAVGPAGGWSEAACRQAQTLLSLGPMTLPHDLARVVLAEQLYRAFTILAGHPYHSGH